MNLTDADPRSGDILTIHSRHYADGQTPITWGQRLVVYLGQVGYFSHLVLDGQRLFRVSGLRYTDARLVRPVVTVYLSS